MWESLLQQLWSRTLLSEIFPVEVMTSLSIVVQGSRESALTGGNRRRSWSVSHRITLRWWGWKRNVEPATGREACGISKDGCYGLETGTFSDSESKWVFMSMLWVNEYLPTVPETDMMNFDLHIFGQSSGLQHTCGGVWEGTATPTQHATVPPISTSTHPHLRISLLPMPTQYSFLCFLSSGP